MSYWLRWLERGMERSYTASLDAAGRSLGTLAQVHPQWKHLFQLMLLGAHA